MLLICYFYLLYLHSDVKNVTSLSLFIKITHAISPDDFHFVLPQGFMLQKEPHSLTTSEIKRLFESNKLWYFQSTLNKYFQNPKNRDRRLLKLRLGSFCAFKDNFAYFRSKIVAIDKQLVTIDLVDYGKVQKVEAKLLFYLPIYFLEPAQFSFNASTKIENTNLTKDEWLAELHSINCN